MKRLIATALFLFSLTFLAACGGKDAGITLDFSFGQQSGVYTGEMAAGLPHGQGKFIAKNAGGEEIWTYEGEFVNGHMEGEGKTAWPDGTVEIGTYKNDVIVPLSGAAIQTLFTSPAEFKDRVIELTGKIFIEPQYNDNGVTLQIYNDTQNYSDNTVVYFSDKNFSADYDDFVIVTGLVGDVLTGINGYGVEISTPTIYARSIEVVSYANAAAPAISEIAINKTYTQSGYAITLQKVEFAESETRVYLKVENNGINKFDLYSFGVALMQNGRQFGEQINWEANYPEIQTGLIPSASTEGIIAFPAIEAGAFQLVLEAQTSDWNEKIRPYKFDVNADGTVNEPLVQEIIVNETLTQFGYSVTLQKVEFAESETMVYLKIENNGAEKFNLSSFNALLMQNGKQYSELRDYSQLQTGLMPSTSTEGVIAFPAVEAGNLQLVLDAYAEGWNEKIRPYEFDVNADGTVNSPLIYEPIDNKAITQYGYSVTVQKIEFGKSETLVYLNIKNNGTNNFSLSGYDSLLIQDGKHYDYLSKYSMIPPGLSPSASAESIIVFPAIQEGTFKLILDAYSDNWLEDIKPYEFRFIADEWENLIIN